MSTIQTNNECGIGKSYLKQGDDSLIETKREKKPSEVMPINLIKSLRHIQLKA